MADLLMNSSTDINELVSILSTTLDENLFFSELANFIKAEMGVGKVRVNLVLSSGLSKSVAINGEMLTAEHVRKNSGIVSHILRTQRAYFSNSVQRDPIFEDSNDEIRTAELAYPISSEGVIIATIHLSVMDDERTFSAKDINSLLSILNYVERPLRNMKLYISAKSLNDVLLKKIELQEHALSEKERVPEIADSFKIQEKKIVNISDSMKKLLSLADRLSKTEEHALVVGELGAGREMVAKRIHCRSKRGNRAFAAIDCSGMNEQQLEAEIFGIEKGLHSVKERSGIIELINGGTLLLKNIHSLTFHLQLRILRFLKDGIAFRVGGKTPYKTNIRILGITDRNLKEDIEKGIFSEELYYYLNSMILIVPPLRERLEDIEALASHFLNKDKNPEELKSLSPGAVRTLNEYRWPGNVRELKSIIARAYIISDGKIIEKDHLADSVIDSSNAEMQQSQENEIEFSEMTLNDLERKHMFLTLEHLGGNKTKTAKALGITVKTLYNKLHSYGMIEVQDS